MENKKFSMLRVLRALKLLLVAIVFFLMIMFMLTGASNDSLDDSIRMILLSATALIFIISWVFLGASNAIITFCLLFLMGFFTFLNVFKIFSEPFDATVWTYMGVWLICYIVACVVIYRYFKPTDEVHVKRRRRLPAAKMVNCPDGTATSTANFTITSGTNTIDDAALVWVPGGTFTMGLPESVGRYDEEPAQQVTLTGFWLYKYEVTVAQYRAFCTVTKRALPNFPTDYSWETFRVNRDGGSIYAIPNFPTNYSWEGKCGWDDPALQLHPIVNVSWIDAQAYSAWAKVALPTEAQWEYAARGPEGRNYPWGGIAIANKMSDGWDATKCANNENSADKGISTWPVGSFPAGASWCGAQDLAGNVLEWCADWYGEYSAMQVTNPIGPVEGEVRVLRGGSWDSNEYYHGNRSANRNYDNPDSRNNDLGFRCVSLLPRP